MHTSVCPFLVTATLATKSLSKVRKGAWTEEEDVLLRNCIQKYGEGQWHQVPLRAGLNQCRKSCRSRWLNYLSPNIKRGEFESDEVDLIIKLPKLSGTRWSLIAGRLPGRTANDVKNYWNTHLRRKFVSHHQQQVKEIAQKEETIPTKPRDHIVSKNLTYLETIFGNNIQSRDNISEPSPVMQPQEENILWWDCWLVDKEGEKASTCFISEKMEEKLITKAKEIAPVTEGEATFHAKEGSSGWDDLYFDMDNLWDL